MPLRLALGYEHVVDRRPFPFDPPAFDATMIWHARTEESPPHKWFRRLIALKSIAETSLSPAKSKPCGRILVSRSSTQPDFERAAPTDGGQGGSRMTRGDVNMGK
jgi:hypothetical protein